MALHDGALVEDPRVRRANAARMGTAEVPVANQTRGDGLHAADDTKRRNVLRFVGALARAL